MGKGHEGGHGDVHGYGHGGWAETGNEAGNETIIETKTETGAWTGLGIEAGTETKTGAWTCTGTLGICIASHLLPSPGTYSSFLVVNISTHLIQKLIALSTMPHNNI